MKKTIKKLLLYDEIYYIDHEYNNQFVLSIHSATTYGAIRLKDFVFIFMNNSIHKYKTINSFATILMQDNSKLGVLIDITTIGADFTTFLFQNKKYYLHLEDAVIELANQQQLLREAVNKLTL